MLVFIAGTIICIIFASAVVYELRRLDDLISSETIKNMASYENISQSSKNIVQLGLILQSVLQLLNEEELKQVDENYKKNLELNGKTNE